MLPFPKSGIITVSINVKPFVWETFRPDIIAWVAFPGDIIARRAFRGPVTLPRGDISHPALVPWSQDWVWSAQTSGLMYTPEHGLCPLWVHF